MKYTWGQFRPHLRARTRVCHWGALLGWRHFVHRQNCSLFFCGSGWKPARVTWLCQCHHRTPVCGNAECRRITEVLQRRTVMDGSPAAGPSASPETRVLTSFTNVILHLTTTRYTDGSVRTQGWITFRTWKGQWEIVIKEPDSEACLTVSGNTVDDALVLADTLLGDPKAPWQHDPFLARGGKKKGK